MGPRFVPFILYVFILFTISFASSSVLPQSGSAQTVRKSSLSHSVHERAIALQVVQGFNAPLSTIKRMAHLIIILKNGPLKRTSKCSATVIKRRWLLTAAHCFLSGNGIQVSVKDTYAFVGEARASLRLNNTSIRPYFAERILVHKGFQPKLYDYRNDIALIRLNRPIVRDEYSRVNLSRARRFDPKPGDLVWAAGYGHIDNKRTPAVRLQEGNIKLEGFDKCKAATDPKLQPLLEDKNQVCAVPSATTLEGLTDTCRGDSGGPLFIRPNNTDSIFQFGLTSFANTQLCAQPETVAWYTRVSTQRRAIRQGQHGIFTFWNVMNA